MDKNEKILLGTKKIKDSDGVLYPCTFTIAKAGYIPDVYVETTTNIGNKELYDDDKFVNNCMKFLKTLGYKGDTFGRCELGMQGDKYVALEPSKEFSKFVIEKYGFVDLNKHYVNEYLTNCPQCGEALPYKTKFTSECPKCEFFLTSGVVFANVKAQEYGSPISRTVTWDEALEILNKADAIIVKEFDELVIYLSMYDDDTIVIYNDTSDETFYMSKDKNAEVMITTDNRLVFVDSSEDDEDVPESERSPKEFFTITPLSKMEF